MLHGKVQSIETNFLFKQTFVVVCCAIGWTYGFFVSWTAVQTHTACIIRSKSLTQTVIMTCYIYTRIQVWKTNIQVMESDGIISDSFISISSIDKTVWNLELSGNWVKVKAMFTVYRIACAPPRKSYRIGLLFTQKKRLWRRDFRAGRREALPRRSLKWTWVTCWIHVDVHTLYLMASRSATEAIPYNVIMLFTGREVRIGRNSVRGLEYRPRPTASGGTQTEGTVSHNTDRPRPVNNTFTFLQLR